MKFKDLYRLYESEIVFQYPGEDEALARDKVYSIQQFEKWFKKHESDLIWNEQAKGYDSNENIDLFNLDLSIIAIQFNIVKGNFDCSYNSLISLEGSPREVKGSFYCHYNQITSLKGCPKKIEGTFDCSRNYLILLEGCPKIIKKSFYCYNNNLTSLEGSPEIINGDFNCSDNKLKSLKGSPKIIKGCFNCSNNQLISLEGCPEEVRGNFFCCNNKVKFTEEQIRSVCKIGGKIYIYI